MLYNEGIVYDIEHLDDSCRADVSFCDASEERVASQIVQTVHVELAGDELMEKALGVLVLEN